MDVVASPLRLLTAHSSVRHHHREGSLPIDRAPAASVLTALVLGQRRVLSRPLWTRAILLLGLSGCQEVPPTDADHYLAAITASDPSAGLTRCDAVRAPGLRGDCQATLAEQLLTPQSSMAEITETCERIEDATWRSECWFMAADMREVTGSMVWGACEQTGRYREFCFDHALQRELALVSLPYGEEDAGLLAIATLIRFYFPGESAQQQQARFNRVLAHRISQRWEQEDFDPSLCSPLPDPLCAFAYHRSISTDRVVLEAVCEASEPTAAHVRSLGGRGWTDHGAAIATWAWRDLCALISRGTGHAPSHLPRHLLPMPTEP